MKVLKSPAPQVNPYQTTPLPILQNIAVYYRQSTHAQVGNVSTTLQTVDMVEHLKMLGWQQECIVLIELDRGMSGTKGIRERPGMSILYDLIERREIGAVAAQDVDRFFREVEQIETNIFIDACRRNSILVLTPTFVYDFAHPIQGHFHMQLFREQAQRASDFIEFKVKGQMLKSRSDLAERGLYVGHRIPFGYMVDMRIYLPDGSNNPNYRKYVRFKLWADVAVTHFELFFANNGNLTNTLRMIEANGLGFPKVTLNMIPPGFIGRAKRKTDPLVGKQLLLTVRTLTFMLTNVAYIGHWVHNETITRWNNHEAIIPLDLFMYAFNRLSPTDFQGDPNPDYIPYRQWLRRDGSGRAESQPTYRDLVFTNDLTPLTNKEVHTIWNPAKDSYAYELRDLDHKPRWDIQAYIIDHSVDNLLINHLREMIINNVDFDRVIVTPPAYTFAKIKQLEKAVRDGEQTKANHLSILNSLTNTEMIEYVQMSHANVDRQLRILRSELEMVQAEIRTETKVMDRNQAELRLESWQSADSRQKRLLFEWIAVHILMTEVSSHIMHIEIHWRDGTSSGIDIPRRIRRYTRKNKKTQALCEMIENNVDQVEILRAFPKITWRSLKERYVRWIAVARWPRTYTGNIKYSERLRWADTEEAKHS